jgi:hypothetical protein
MSNEEIIPKIYSNLDRIESTQGERRKSIIGETYVLYNQIDHGELSEPQRKEVDDLGKILDDLNRFKNI